MAAIEFLPLECAEYRSLLISKSTVAVGFLEEPVVKEVLRCDILTVPLVVGWMIQKRLYIIDIINILL